MPVGLFLDLMRHAPYLAVPLVIVWSAHKIISKLVDSPLTIATIVSVLGPKHMRDDAYRTIKALRGDNEDGPPEIEQPPSPPPETGRRARWKRRR